jgi:hypothetical protein
MSPESHQFNLIVINTLGGLFVTADGQSGSGIIAQPRRLVPPKVRCFSSLGADGSA